jgi:hypothetical protein
MDVSRGDRRRKVICDEVGASGWIAQQRETACICQVIISIVDYTWCSVGHRHWRPNSIKWPNYTDHLPFLAHDMLNYLFPFLARLLTQCSCSEAEVILGCQPSEFCTSSGDSASTVSPDQKPFNIHGYLPQRTYIKSFLLLSFLMLSFLMLSFLNFQTRICSFKSQTVQQWI